MIRTILLLLAFGCALEEEPEPDPGRICVAGATKECVYSSTSVGAQTCRADGMAWGECEEVVTPPGGCVEDADCPLAERAHCISDVCVGEGGRCMEPSDCAGSGYPNCVAGGCER